MILFHTATFGCKINQYETRSIAETWRELAPEGGYPEVVEVDDPSRADVILVNSCAVTANAVSDLRQSVRRFHRDNPDARIIITGCAAQVVGDELAKLPGVVRVVGQADKAGLLAGPDAESRSIQKSSGSVPVFAPFHISEYHRARPVVKIQDGCSHRCTFCIVPLARGRSVSRPVAEIEAEVARLLDAGFREMILSGVNLRHFGRDLKPVQEFWDLVAHLESAFADQWAGRARFRISSLEPGQLDDHALSVLAHSRIVCPQLHISLQSGDPQVLKRMGRGHYRAEQAVEFCDKLREIWPEFGLGADLLVGFPGETDKQFENTMAICDQLPLTYGHVFPYSQRPGTPAAEMKDQVDVAVRKSRAARLRTLVNKKKKSFLEHLGTLPELLVLVQDEQGKGLCEFYAPCFIDPASMPLRPRSLVQCKPVTLRSGVLHCVPL